MAFEMNGWSAFTKVDDTKKKTKTKTKKTEIKDGKDLPTFREGDVTISQYDKDGNKRYNIVGE